MSKLRHVLATLTAQDEQQQLIEYVLPGEGRELEYSKAGRYPKEQT